MLISDQEDRTNKYIQIKNRNMQNQDQNTKRPNPPDNKLG